MPSDTKISQLTTVTLEDADMIPIVDATTGENRKVLAGALASVLTTTAAAAAYQPLDGDLTSLAGASGTNTIYYRSAADTWSAVTIGSNLSFSGGTLSATAGGGSVTLTGDVTGSGTGSFATTIANDAVTYAKFQDASAGNVVLARAAPTSGDFSEVAISASQLLGRGSTGNIAAITLGSNLSISGTTLSASGEMTRGQVLASNQTLTSYI